VSTSGRKGYRDEEGREDLKRRNGMIKAARIIGSTPQVNVP
jgi:hypothetical protein